MQHNMLQTVTSTLPVLIPCDDEVADGFVGGKSVRVVTSTELVELGYKAAREKRPPKEVPNWLYLLHLKLLSDAGDRQNLTDARKAAKVIVPHLPIFGVQGEFDRQEFVRGLEEFTARDALGAGVNVGGWISTTVQGCVPVKLSRANQAERVKLSIRANSNLTEAARTAGHAKLPPLRFERRIEAMMCPDLARAYAYVLFFDGVGVCPRCQTLFTRKAKKTGNKAGKKQVYCSRACGDSHRMARWREGQRLRREGLAKRKAEKSRRGGKR